MAGDGSTTVNFGSFTAASTAHAHPHTEAKATVTGQGGIVTGSLVDAWVRVASSADHSADEHAMEALRVVAGGIVAGTGFDIYAECTVGGTHGVFNVDWAWK